MQRTMLTVQRLVAVFLAGLVFFNYPVLALFDKTATLLGVPIVFVYLFAVWAVVIAAMAWVVEKPERVERHESRERSGS